MLARQDVAQGMKLHRMPLVPDAHLQRGDEVVFRMPFAPIVAPSKNFLTRIGAPHGVCGLGVALNIVLVSQETAQDLDQERIRLSIDSGFNLANDLATASFTPQRVSPALKFIKELRTIHLNAFPIVPMARQWGRDDRNG